MFICYCSSLPGTKCDFCTGQRKMFDLYWSPEGRKIATVEATDERKAIRKAPQPYRKFLGEIYAQVAEPRAYKFITDDIYECRCGKRQPENSWGIHSPGNEIGIQ